MLIDRRQLLGVMLTGFMAGGAGADVPRGRLFVSCRRDAADNASVACFDRDGREVFATSLPARGHDVTRRPRAAEIVAFARRPGNWFAVLGSADGSLRQVVEAAEGRHFYGHGAFSADGRLLHATENLIATGEGLIGIYDASDGYRRIGEMPSGGIGPHDLALLPGGRGLIIANGGLRTHPDTGRETLNPEDMKPNLALLDLRHGEVTARHELAAELRRLSIRHLAVRGDGVVAFGGQYQGAAEDAPPLIGLLRPGGTPAMLAVEGDALFAMNNYIGSVAFDDDGGSLIATSPEGGAALIWDMAGDRLAASLRLPDVCGAAANGRQSFIVTSGNAGITTLGLSGLAGPGVEQRWIWDNHARVLREAGQADD
ncbi:DUF1513 domain-containing protein [Aestuariivirga litoralis]|uniref:DUF1513 domain-containing protein n=1 Tax=Aestuariivirga litoralis TaxID=2650924 RepID=A0A2W2AS74_9HYPH|nr:DUF1513 domain-containing protein [Aestuariivirga litoralis]PZF75340.1 DUF1513 domain-containing protein [Aestuariivirga litoralis]